MAPRTRNRHGYTVFRLPDRTSLFGSVLEEALQDNKQTPVPDQVTFRMDFPAWVKTLSRRDRRVLRDLMKGERTHQVAKKYRLSPSRVSQLRRAFQSGWETFDQSDT